MGTKNEPGTFDCFHKAEDDEPMFILLARDPMAPALVCMWADTREVIDPECATEKLGEARRCADAMEEWKGDNPDHGFPSHALNRRA